jgi:hypothetical protein
MPIEIRELVIRTVVGQGAAGTNKDGGEVAPAVRHDAANTDEIVQECVRQVLRILEKNKER